jgi:hypothetical protein
VLSLSLSGLPPAEAFPFLPADSLAGEMVSIDNHVRFDTYEITHRPIGLELTTGAAFTRSVTAYE